MSGPLSGVAITVVGMSYAPEPTGIGPYTAGMAEMLVGHGALVEAVTGVPHYPSWDLRPEDRWVLRRREELNGVEVRRVRHHVPARQSALRRLLWEGTFLANAALVRPTRRPDVVLGVSPSLSGLVVARRAARRHGAPWAAVVQDLVGLAARQSGLRTGGPVAEAAARIEGGALLSADLVAVVSDTFRRQLSAYGVSDDRVRLLPNWSHIAAPSRSRDDVRRQLGWPRGTFVVLHSGNMGLKQDLGNVVEAGRLLSGVPDVLLVVMGDGNQRSALEEAAVGVDRVRLLPPVPDDLYPDVLKAADLLLINERPTVGDMSLPSKLTSYLSVGQPVLAAVSADGACARESARTGGAVLRVDPGSPAALAQAVLDLRARAAELPGMGRAGRAYAQRALGHETAAANVLALVSELLDHGPRRAAQT